MEKFNIEDIRQLLKKGLGLHFVFGLSQEYLLWNNTQPDLLAEAFQIFREHGLPASEVDKWIDEHFKYALLDDLALDLTGRWHTLGIDTSRYVEEFVKLNAYHYMDKIPQKPPDIINDVEALTTVSTTTDPVKIKKFYYEVLRRAGAAPHVLAKYKQ